MAIAWRKVLSTIVDAISFGGSEESPTPAAPPRSGVEQLGAELARARADLADGHAREVVGQLDEMLDRLGIFTAAAWAVRGAAHEQLVERSPSTKAYRRAVKAYDEAEAMPSADEALAIARALGAVGRAQHAADLLARTSEAFPDRTDVLADLATRREALGDRTAAAVTRARLADLVSGPGRVAALRAAVELDPTTGAYRLRLGDALMADGDAGGAVEVLRDAAESFPADVDVAAALAEAIERSGDADEALRRAVAVLDHQPDHRRALLVHARLLSRRGEHAPALAAVEQVLAAHPDDVDAHETRFAVVLDAGRPGDTDGTLADLDAVAATDPTRAVALAEGLISRGLDPLATAAFRRLTALAPDDARAWLGLGRVLYRTAAPGAPEALRRAAYLANAQSRVDDEAEALAWLGELHRRSGDTDEALDALNRSLDLRRTPFALACRGRVRGARDESTAAIEDLTAAVSAEPSLSWAFLDLAEQYRLRRDFTRACEALDAAARGGDDSAFLHGTRGQIQWALGNTEPAIAELRAALLREPAPWIVNELADVLLDAANDADDFEEIRDLVDLGLEASPGALQLWRTKAEVLRLLGQPFDGLELMDRYLEAVPGDQAALATRAHLLVDVGQAASALDLVRGEWVDDPSYRSARSAAVRALSALDRQSEAMEVLGELLDRYPDDAWLLRTRVSLRCALRELTVALYEAKALLATNPDDLWMNGGAGYCERRLDPPELDAAVTHLRAADAGTPPDAGIKVELAEALTRRGDPGAATLYQEVIDLANDASRPDDWLTGLAAWSALRLDRIEEAVAGFETAVHLDPSRPAHRLSLGLALVRAGREELGIDEYEVGIDVAVTQADARRSAAIIRESIADLFDIVPTAQPGGAAAHAHELMAAAVERLEGRVVALAAAGAAASEMKEGNATDVP